MALREAVAAHLRSLRTRLEAPLPEAPEAKPAEVARAVFALVASLLMVMLGILLMRGLAGGVHQPMWWEFVLGFVLVGAALRTLAWALLAHAPGP